jgi:hypothetical protein
MALDNGDMYIRDTGEYLATIDEEDMKKVFTPIPVEIDIIVDGYTYTYTLSQRTQNEEETKDPFINL